MAWLTVRSDELEDGGITLAYVMTESRENTLAALFSQG
jgi:hypothetical protein